MDYQEIHELQLQLSKHPDGIICNDCGCEVAHRLNRSECKHCLYKGGDSWMFSRMLDIDKMAAVLILRFKIEKFHALEMAASLYLNAAYEGGQDCS